MRSCPAIFSNCFLLPQAMDLFLILFFFFSQLTEKSGDIFVVLVILSYPEPLLQLNTV